MISINGEKKEITNISVKDIIHKEGYNEQRIAVEINGNIIPKSQYGECIIQDGDTVEIVSFVGGG